MTHALDPWYHASPPVGLEMQLKDIELVSDKVSL